MGFFNSTGERAVIDVAVIERNPIFRDGLTHILSQAGYNVRSFSDDVHRFGCEELQEVYPLLFVVDLEHSNSSVADVVTSLRLINNRAHIVCLTNEHDENLVFQAVRAGVSALLCKQINGEVLTKSLELVLLGERLFPVPCVGVKSIELAPELGDETANAMKKLSARELEVLDCLSIGSPNKIIARKFGITEATVKVHVKAILRKIPARNRTEAAMWAKKYGVHSAAAFDRHPSSQIEIAELSSGAGVLKPPAEFVSHHSSAD